MRKLKGIDLTRIKHMKDPEEVLLPNRDLVLVAFCEDESEHWIPFPLLFDLPLNPRHDSAIETPVSGRLFVCVTGLAHEVRSPITSRMD